jgi:hypothetical protein
MKKSIKYVKKYNFQPINKPAKHFAVQTRIKMHLTKEITDTINYDCRLNVGCIHQKFQYVLLRTLVQCGAVQ